MSAEWFSQPVPALGGSNGEGIRRSLGIPDLDPLTILVREAAQNSWDAGVDKGNTPVRFRMDLLRTAGPLRAAWERVLLAGAPSADHLPLVTALGADELEILMVSDRGTRGLGGPTRADEGVEGENHDYKSFVLNTGDPRDQELGGGTYGFGKAVYFSGSATWTVLIHTRCAMPGGGAETRIVGMALGAGFTDGGRKFTGRHWWGEPREDDVFAPVTGPEADRLAEELGFPAFVGDETGTSIAIIAPRFGDRTSEEGMRWIASAMAWHLWPKLVPDPSSGTLPMTLSVSFDGVDIPVPAPTEHPVLREFVRAYSDLDQGVPVTYRQRAIGTMQLQNAFAPIPTIDTIGLELGFGDGVHHTCLLRGPRLVVNYRQGLRTPNPHVWYTGVFLADVEFDHIFAQAEPPTHDAWIVSKLEGQERGIVNKALTEIGTRMRRHATPATDPDGVTGQETDGLAGMSRALGSLLAPAPGGAAGPRHGTAPGPRGPAPITMLGTPQWTTEDDRHLLVQRFRTPNARTVTVRAALKIVVWGGGRPADDDPAPVVHGWRAPDGELLRDAPEVTIRAERAGEWELLVIPVPNAATDVRVELVPTPEADDA